MTRVQWREVSELFMQLFIKLLFPVFLSLLTLNSLLSNICLTPSYISFHLLIFDQAIYSERSVRAADATAGVHLKTMANVAASLGGAR